MWCCITGACLCINPLGRRQETPRRGLSLVDTPTGPKQPISERPLALVLLYISWTRAKRFAMSDQPYISTVFQSLLDQSELRDYFVEVGSTELVDVDARVGDERCCGECKDCLETLERALVLGDVTRATITYRFGEMQWQDTIQNVGIGFQIVRMKRPQSEGESPGSALFG